MNPAPLIAFLLIPAPALAFAELDRAVPRVGSTIAAAPKTVVLNFSEAPESATGEVRDSLGARVDVGGLKIDRSDRQRGFLTVKSLGPGEYTVRWWAKADDGDETQGRFLFRVAP